MYMSSNYFQDFNVDFQILNSNMNYDLKFNYKTQNTNMISGAPFRVENLKLIIRWLSLNSSLSKTNTSAASTFQISIVFSVAFCCIHDADRVSNVPFSTFKFSSESQSQRCLLLRSGMGDIEHTLCFSLYLRCVIAFSIMIHVAV